MRVILMALIAALLTDFPAQAETLTVIGRGFASSPADAGRQSFRVAAPGATETEVTRIEVAIEAFAQDTSGLHRIETNRTDLETEPQLRNFDLPTRSASGELVIPEFPRDRVYEIEARGTRTALADLEALLISTIGPVEIVSAGWSAEDLSEARLTAMRRALEDADAEARRLAEASGLTLGDRLSIIVQGGESDQLNAEERVLQAGSPDQPVVGVRINLAVAYQAD
jgi:uncharacterized protein YggE